MEKYRKVQKQKEFSPQDEVRVTGSGHVCNYVTYTARLFNENHNHVTIRATGKAVAIAVHVAEVVKRRFKGIHQLTTIGSTELVSEYEPLEEGLDRLTETRTVSFISIKLARDESAADLDREAPGYQDPLDESLVKELNPEAVSRFSRGRGRRGRGGRGGRGGGYRGGRGRGGYRGSTALDGAISPPYSEGQPMVEDYPRQYQSGGDGEYNPYSGPRRGRGGARGGRGGRGGYAGSPDSMRGRGRPRGGRRGRGGPRGGPRGGYRQDGPGVDA